VGSEEIQSLDTRLGMRLFVDNCPPEDKPGANIGCSFERMPNGSVKITIQETKQAGRTYCSRAQIDSTTFDALIERLS
jgi:hypothetical protein